MTKRSDEWRTWCPVAVALSPGHVIGLIVSEWCVARHVWKSSSSNVLFVVANSSKAGNGEVDNVELIVLKFVYRVIVSENQCNSICTSAVPGGFRCDISSDLIANSSVIAATVLHPAGNSGDLENSGPIGILQCRTSDNRLVVGKVVVVASIGDSWLDAVGIFITRVGWPAIFLRNCYLITIAFVPFNCKDELFSAITGCIIKWSGRGNGCNRVKFCLV